MGTSSCSSVVSEKQSYRPKWRPRSLSASVLVPLISYTILLMVALAVLQRKSNRDGGILFADSVEDMPFSYIFIQNYLPTIAAVLYNTICVWIDLDIKRLEPWYNLSQKAGANGENSVLLDYPAEFLPLVPLKSMKNRQWTVLSSSLVVLLASWVVTPLQSGIFALRTIQKSEILPMVPVKELISLEDQANKLSLEFMNRGYSVGWLNMSMPPYSTRSYALAPFEPVSEREFFGHNQYWTGNTVLYQADLNCHSARSAMLDPDTLNLSLDDGEGCFAKDVVYDVPVKSYGGQYITFWGSHMDPKPVPSHTLNNTCGERALHESLAFWKCSNRSTVAIFCWSEYYEQDVEATITLGNKSVHSIRPIGGRRKLPETVFNSSRFEQIISTQIVPGDNPASPQTPIIRHFDRSGSASVQLNSKLDDLVVSAYGTSLVPFMLGITNYTLEELCSPVPLAAAYQDTYRTLFALAVQSLFSETAYNTSSDKGILQSSVGAVVMVGTFTYMAIGFLAIIALLLTYILCAYRGRILNLPYSPNSIGSILAIARRQMERYSVFHYLSSADNAEFVRKLTNVWFYLEHDNQEMRLISNHVEESEDGPLIKHEPIDHTLRTWPWPLHKIVGLAFLTILTTMILTIGFLRYLIWRQNGLPLFSQDSFLQQLVLDYLPTIIATAIEPFWTVLNRLLCVIQPFISLRTRNALATNSILLEYTSVPPQLAAWRALQSHHWLLAAVCVVTLAANILTIGMSGLFDIRETAVNHSVTVDQLMRPTFRSAVLVEPEEPMQQMLANLSDNVPMLPWITPDYFFLPVSLPNESHALTYLVTTTGLGSDLQCSEAMDISVPGANMTYTFGLNHDATQANFTFRERLANGTQIRCYYPGANLPDGAKADDNPPPEETQIYIQGNPEGRQGVEFIVKAYPSYNTRTPDENFFCERMIIAGWVRANITLTADYSETVNGPTRNISDATLDSMFMRCRPRFMIGNFSVLTDKDGHVLDYSQVGNLSEDIEWRLVDRLWSRTATHIGTSGPRWHNDSYADDWFNEFMKIIAGNADIIDPFKPKPNFTTTAALMSKVYRQLFAITALNNRENFARAPPGTTTTAIEIFREQRIFMNDAMFYIVIGVLAANIVVASFLYLGLPKPFLHQMPTSIAGLLSYTCGSHLAEDLNLASHTATSKTEVYENLARQNNIYGLGKYIGMDGNVHFGIDRQPYLLPEWQSEPGKWSRFWRKLFSSRSSNHVVI